MTELLDSMVDELGRDLGDVLARQYPAGFIPLRDLDAFVRCVRARLADFAASEFSQGRTLEQLAGQVGSAMVARYVAEIAARTGHA